MHAEDKVKVFAPGLEQFETEKMRLYCEDMIKEIPNYIFEMPSSTTGKYHNKTQCQVHGQVYHIIMFAEIVNYRLALKGNREKFKSPEQRDAIRCVAYFHDALKLGNNKSSYSVFEHPLLAAEWVRNTMVEHDIEPKIKDAIADMCAAHSGEFCTSSRSKIVLPEPKNAMEFFIHECDILSSRNNIDMQPPEYLKDIFEDINTPLEFDENYTLTFGKYSGQRLIDVNRFAPDYILWCEENLHKPDLLKAIKAMKEYLKNKENTNEN